MQELPLWKSSRREMQDGIDESAGSAASEVVFVSCAQSLDQEIHRRENSEMLIRDQILNSRTRAIDFARGGTQSTFRIKSPTRGRNTGFLTSRFLGAGCSSTRCRPLLPAGGR